MTFNDALVLSDCIKSKINQSHGSIEHIIVDGGSNDGTKDILNKYQNNLSKIISEPDDGIYHAMNKGIKYASGVVVGFLNSDDFYFDNDVLSKVFQIFKSNPSINACYSDLVYVDKLTASKLLGILNQKNLHQVYFSRVGVLLTLRFCKKICI